MWPYFSFNFTLFEAGSLSTVDSSLLSVLHHCSVLPVQAHQNFLVLNILCPFYFRHHLEAGSLCLGRYHLIIQIAHLYFLEVYKLPGLIESPHHSTCEGVYSWKNSPQSILCFNELIFYHIRYGIRKVGKCRNNEDSISRWMHIKRKKSWYKNNIVK